MEKILVHHNKNKHIDVYYHFLQANIERGLIIMMSCNINDGLSDVFSKALGREQFEKNHLAFGLINQLRQEDTQNLARRCVPFVIE